MRCIIAIMYTFWRVISKMMRTFCPKLPILNKYVVTITRTYFSRYVRMRSTRIILLTPTTTYATATRAIRTTQQKQQLQQKYDICDLFQPVMRVAAFVDTYLFVIIACVIMCDMHIRYRAMRRDSSRTSTANNASWQECTMRHWLSIAANYALRMFDMVHLEYGKVYEMWTNDKCKTKITLQLSANNDRTINIIPPTNDDNIINIIFPTNDGNVTNITLQSPISDDNATNVTLQTNDNNSTNVTLQTNDNNATNITFQTNDENATNITLQTNDENATNITLQTNDENATNITLQTNDENATNITQQTLNYPDLSSRRIISHKQINLHDTWTYDVYFNMIAHILVLLLTCILSRCNYPHHEI